METTTVRIPLDADLAQVYNTASVEDQRKLQLLLSLWLREMGAARRIPLKSLMDDLSDKAQARGLTPELLESLLEDDE